MQSIYKLDFVNKIRSLDSKLRLPHSYEFDWNGKIIQCDYVIPTSQNHANIQHDLWTLAAKCASQGKPDRKIELLAQMLVRSYDPCLSCSVH